MQTWVKQKWAAAWQLTSGVSLRIKIMGIALSTIALLGIALTWQARLTIEQMLTRELEQQAIATAHHVADHSADHIANNDLSALEYLAKGIILYNQDMRYILILSPQGELLAHSFADGLPADFDQILLSFSDQQPYLQEARQTTDGDPIRDITLPVPRDLGSAFLSHLPPDIPAARYA